MLSFRTQSELDGLLSFWYLMQCWFARYTLLPDERHAQMNNMIQGLLKTGMLILSCRLLQGPVWRTLASLFYTQIIPCKPAR